MEEIALQERAVTGEYIRPIILFQAQSHYEHRTSLTVDVLEEHLLKEHHISENQVVRATGTDRGLEGIDLFDPTCPIRYIITVQALREGWDCSFAYVLCTVAEMHGQTVVEQILGRVLRLPKAQNKRFPELNKAYAYTASNHFAEAANALADALVQNGFERQEIRDLIVQPQPIQTELGPIFTWNQNAHRDISSQYILQEDTEKLKFSVPVLAIPQGDFFEQFDESHFLDRLWGLAAKNSHLSEAEYPSQVSDGEQGEIDIDQTGHVSTSFIRQLQNQVAFLSPDQGWSIEQLAVWLDRNIPHIDVPQKQSIVFFKAIVERLIADRGLSQAQLVKDRYRLKQAVATKVQAYRQEARNEVYQKYLLPEFETPLVVKPEVCFTYDPDPMNYPCSPNSLYAGHHTFHKHYYPVVGDLKSSGEEFECAQFIDNQPEVETWVRNLERRSRHSFWLQTSTDKFYPDFVCQLKDSRYLVVEYKGMDHWSNDDSKEKRAIGQVWEERSGGKCLFIMPKGHDLQAISVKMK